MIDFDDIVPYLHLFFSRFSGFVLWFCLYFGLIPVILRAVGIFHPSSRVFYVPVYFGCQSKIGIGVVGYKFCRQGLSEVEAGLFHGPIELALQCLFLLVKSAIDK